MSVICTLGSIRCLTEDIHNFFVYVNLTKNSSNVTFSATTVIVMEGNGCFLEEEVIAWNVMETHKEEKPYRLYY